MSELVKTCLYRHYDSNGGLLYVGISLSAVMRLSQHRSESAWFSEISRIEVQWFDSRREAMDEETRAIQRERPKYNIRCVVDLRDPLICADASREELLRETVRFKPLYPERTLHIELGIPRSLIRNAIAAGQLGFIDLPNATGTRTKRYVTGWQVIDFLEWQQATHGTKIRVA